MAPSAGPPRIYNSLNQSIEPLAFQGTIGVYVCGITPYDAMHLGHAFTYTFFDVLIRYLRFLGYPVTYVQNVTDVDDSILARAAETNQNWRDLGDRELAKFLDQMERLNSRVPDVMPRASQHISEIQRLVQRLLDEGVAYGSGGNVYFQVAQDSTFGK